MSSSKVPQLPRVLVVDDDMISREVLAMMLVMEGIPVDLAEDGSQALRVVESSLTEPLDHRPAVILLDAQMPGLSGVELVVALRAKTKARIIAMSGSDISAEMRQATNGFLMKPVEIDSLLTLVTGSGGSVFGGTKQAARELDSGANGQLEPGELIDPGVLDKLKAMMSAKALRETYAAVATDLETRLDALKKAIDSGNHAEVKRIAHSIKGGCAMVGLSSAAAAAKRLESGNAPERYLAELAQLRTVQGGLDSILREDFLA